MFSNISIGFYAHKGGVGKTTFAYDFAFGLMYHYNKNVVLIDCDSQLNLTFKCLGKRGNEINGDLIDLFIDQGNTTKISIGGRNYDTIYNAMNSNGKISLFDVHSYGDLKLKCLLGSPKNHLLDNQLLLAMTAEDVPLLMDFPNKFVKIINNLKKKPNTIILVDLSPSSSTLNQNFLLSCDYFILPLTSDYHSLTGLKLLLKFLPEWYVRHSRKIKRLKKIKLICCVQNMTKKINNIPTIAERMFENHFERVLNEFKEDENNVDFCLADTKLYQIGDLARMARYLSLSQLSIYDTSIGRVDDLNPDEAKLSEIKADSKFVLDDIINRIETEMML